MQYLQFYGCKNEKFQMEKLEIFLKISALKHTLLVLIRTVSILLKTEIVGLESHEVLG